MNDIVEDIKKTIIDTLNLEDISVEDIKTDEPLFGDGLGLDSIDALELGIALQKKFNVSLKSDTDDSKKYFYSVKTLAEFISIQRPK